MGDACCGTAAIDADDTAGDESGVEWRTVAAAIAAGSWVTGVVAEIAGVEVLATGAFIVAVVAGGSTFAPGALLGLRRGRLTAHDLEVPLHAAAGVAVRCANYEIHRISRLHRNPVTARVDRTIDREDSLAKKVAAL